MTLASLRGKTVVLLDFLTLCQEVCPLTSVNVRAIADAVAKAGLTADVAILQVTVDPTRDTPQRLLAYQKIFGAQPGWSFLTGSAQDITELWNSFGVGYEISTITASPAPKDWLTGEPLTYDVDHQDLVFVIGPDGHERWLVNGTPSVTSPGLVPRRLDSFLNAMGHSNESHAPDPSWTPADVVAAIAVVSGKSLA